ncbi:MAG: C25 family cysteine peptidase, partial [Candidatus Kapaibacterium sp.]
MNSRSIGGDACCRNHSVFAGAISVLLLAGSVRAQMPAGVHVHELRRSGNSVTLEITIPLPQFDTIQGAHYLRRLAGQVENGDALAPIAIPMRLSRKASVAVLSHEDRTIVANNLQLPNRLVQDFAYDGKAGAASYRTRPVNSAHYGIGYAAMSYVGKMRAADISRIEVGILDRSSVNAIREARIIVLKVTDPSGLPAMPVTDMSEPFQVSNSVFKSRLALASASGKRMGALSDSDMQQVPGIQSDDGSVYRMYIRQSGIYHITFDDLRNFGIDPTEIDPATLRIINKGQQVAVYLSDKFQDGHFHSGDYFEFYGEEERYQGPNTCGDFYYDPDTKNNIYYLVWGSHYAPIPLGGGKRVVEESGEIRTANPSPYPRDSFYVDLKDSSFFTTMHIEQDNVFDVLNYSDVDQRSDLRDHNFMAIVSTGGYYPATYTINTVIPYPDVRPNRFLSFRAALHGISNFVPGATDSKGNELPVVDSEDNASLSVNGQFVLHGIWGGQTMKFLSTDTPSQTYSNISAAQLLGVRPADSTGGIPPVAISIAQQKQTSVDAACRFAINWIDIGYDRMYYAYQDALNFHAPPYSTAGLYQFTLGNFDRTDVSIYRKGISKITNVTITSNPTKARSVQAIFQVNVSSGADEFIAVDDSNKLKPYKYEKDDFLNLHSPSNAGKYIIITNRDHLPKGNNGVRTPVEDLADYRGSNNHVTTKVIDVANIYDEFNYGSRSPNAIKAFLTYAYHNWQDPPKYVLLVGVTHEGTDDPQPYTPPDQVPTPYIQAYLEGDVAADAWYSMVDGDDLLPDLILGRLASLDVKTDAAYIAKVKEYEADGAIPGDWKDRALFIGAGGSFEQDIEDILDRDLPERVSVLRQSTLVASPYHGTRQRLFDNVNNGLGLVAYFGHGGADIWDDPIDSSGGGPFLTNEDVGNFHNQARYPLILSMTCFTAAYDGNGLLGILNSLQNEAESGSIASMGTTSYGWEQNDTHLAEAVIPQVYDSTGGSIAERIIDGKMDYLLEGLSGDLIPPTLMYAYHFLGDPMLGLHPPTDRASLSLSSRVIQPSGTVTINGTSSIQQGTASVELANDQHSPLAPPDVMDNIPVTNGAFSITANVPNTTMPYGSYRAIVYDKSSN